MRLKQTAYFTLITFVIFTTACRDTAPPDTANTGSGGIVSASGSLPSVFAGNHADLIAARMKNEAYLRFIRFHVPESREELASFKVQLKDRIMKKAGIAIDHRLPLQVEETGSVKMNGFTIKSILFQTLPGVYATGSLYIPDGKGPFPAVINLNGHWPEARLCGPVQAVGITLAMQGYVSLSIDAFGAGERSTVHGIPDYHGANPGASLMNIGKTLLGIQVSENMRGVDLLCSLPNVDPQRIGATGASGGGNQTMWLTALDERVKAAVTVVSVGTFESYIMESNCICELLPDGLTLSEESGILALIAPRAILMCNHKQDSNPTFFPSEMLRTYNNALPVFEMLGAKENIGFRIFDLEHDYAAQDREAMLGWFDLHLKEKGNGEAVKEIPFKILPADQLMSCPKGKRDPKVITLERFCRQGAVELRNKFLTTKLFDKSQKVNELLDILRISDFPVLKNVQQYESQGGWDRFILETSDGRLIPLLHVAPRKKIRGYVIVCDPKGKNNTSPALIEQLTKQGSGIVLVDLSGTGETRSAKAWSFDQGVGDFHTLARADLWLGKTVMGDWVGEIEIITQFLYTRFQAAAISLNGSREAGLAALFYALTAQNNIVRVEMREAPVSYVFDTREGISFFSMAVHLPGFLEWGDVSLAAALCGKNITITNPVTMSGSAITGEKLREYKAEFEKMKKICRQPGDIIFEYL
jgi:hypothetical protein